MADSTAATTACATNTNGVQLPTAADRPIALKGRADSRWYQHLKVHSAPFAQLCAAQERGWTSEAVGKWFGDRNGTSGGAGADFGKDVAATAAPTTTAPTAPATTTSGGTVFTADSFNLDSLCEKYKAHAESILPKGNGTLFRTTTVAASAAAATATPAASGGATTNVRGRGFIPRGGPAAAAANVKALLATRPFSFLDLGSAPGGVSYALFKAQQRQHAVEQQQRKARAALDAALGAGGGGAAAAGDAVSSSSSSSSFGVSVSLAVDAGGIGMSPAMLKECTAAAAGTTTIGATGATASSSSSSYAVLYNSVAEVEGTLAMVKETCAANGMSANGTAATAAKFDLVNGGAVADFGQRDDDHHPASSSASSGNTAVRPLPPRYPVPWFQLFAPQLLIALGAVRDGGDIMIVYGLSDSCSLLLLCDLMAPLLYSSGSSGSGSGSSASSSITFLPTMHFTKPPIYVYFKGIHQGGGGGSDGEAIRQRIADELQVYSEGEEAALKAAVEQLRATTGDGNDGSNVSNATAIAALNDRIGALWSRYRSMHAYWSGEDDAAQQKAERVWTEGVALTPSSSSTAAAAADDITSAVASRIPIRPQLEQMWQDRADALNAKLNRIEQQAAKRPAVGNATR